MSTNFKELFDFYEKKLEEINVSNNINEPSIVKINSNARKIRDGIYSITFTIPTRSNPSSEEAVESAPIKVTLYIADRRKTTSVLFVNDKTHEVIFNSVMPDAIEKAEKYVCNYIDRNVKKYYGISLEDNTSNE